MVEIDQYKINIARRWMNEGNNLYNGSGDYKKSIFAGYALQYICYEIIQKDYGGPKKLVNSLSDHRINRIYNQLSTQRKSFKDRSVQNMQNNPSQPDSSKYNKILQNNSSTKRDKIWALLNICRMIRNNLVHGDKDVHDGGDQSLIRASYRILKVVNKEVLNQTLV